jgi:hypothetical protein
VEEGKKRTFPHFLLDFFSPSFFSFKRGWKKGAKKPTEEQVSKQRKE